MSFRNFEEEVQKILGNQKLKEFINNTQKSHPNISNQRIYNLINNFLKLFVIYIIFRECKDYENTLFLKSKVFYFISPDLSYIFKRLQKDEWLYKFIVREILSFEYTEIFKNEEYRICHEKIPLDEIIFKEEYLDNVKKQSESTDVNTEKPNENEKKLIYKLLEAYKIRYGNTSFAIEHSIFFSESNIHT